MTQTKTALVIGATGGISSAFTKALIRRGWHVRALNRNPSQATTRRPDLNAVEWITGDAMRAADVIAAAEGVEIVFHGANPPGYKNWKGTVVPMLDSTIAAAEVSGARIVFPGTIYNYGPDAFPILSETSPQRPLSRKGRIRVEMEARLANAAQRGVRTLIVRAGDYFGPGAGSNWFGDAMIRHGQPVRSVWNPGKPGVSHAWAYLPDVAEAMARLIEREGDLGTFEAFHFGGYWIENTEMPKAIGRITGNPDLKVRQFPWWAVTAAWPFVRFARELHEVRHLWHVPVKLDNRKLVAFLGEEPQTPLDEAVAVSLEGFGCLPAPDLWEAVAAQ